MSDKLAFATDDGETIHSHFGRAQYYEIIEHDDTGISRRTRVPKFAPHFQGHMGMSEHGRHAGMFQALAGVNVLIARGMGMGAISGANALGINVILCDVKTISEAVALYQRGELMHNERRIHHHHQPEHHGHDGCV